ncbi:hypothetical protein LCGC14_1321650 [marine sediment metagenome]|uniref:RNA polymerase alpha subunit C-terminal domain-containing protein n=1 Tax=marine sediment metagenome TaxID=412755 RepID=A0A0F9NLP3_9ZZZZ
MTEENTNGDEAVEGDVPEDETQAAPELDAATQAKLDHLDHLQEMEREASSLESAMKEKNEAYKAAKSRWEEKRTALLTCVRDGPEQPDPQKTLPGMDDKEGWRETPVSEVVGKLAPILEDAGLKTLGELQGYLDNFRLADIVRIGPTKAEEIEEALVTFWKEHPEYCGGADDDAAEPEDEEPASVTTE